MRPRGAAFIAPAARLPDSAYIHRTLPLTPRFQFRPVPVSARLLPLDLDDELRVVFRAPRVQARTPVDLDGLNPAARTVGQTCLVRTQLGLAAAPVRVFRAGRRLP